jgi:hypothetical protein
MKIVRWVRVCNSIQIVRKVQYIHVETPKKSMMASKQFGQYEKSMYSNDKRKKEISEDVKVEGSTPFIDIKE